jgi:hypothetical protein
MDGLVLMDIAFTLFIILHLFFMNEKIVKTRIDKFLSIGGIILSLIILISLAYCNIPLLDIGHFMYCGLYLPIASIFSKNKQILLLNIVMLGTIISSRYYYKGCLMSQVQKNKGYFTELNHSFNLNWWYIFPLLLAITILNYWYM